MANVYLNLPVPATDGVGAAVNCLTQGSLRTIVAGVTPGPSGEGMRCNLNIEISNAVAAPVADDEWAPVASFSADFGDDITVYIAAKWARVRRANSRFPAGVATVSVGSTDDGTTLAALVATAGNGAGASVDVSAFGPWKTVIVGSAFRGNVNVEISEDGTFFSTQFSFLGGGGAAQQSAAFMAKFMRVTRDGVPVISPGLPLVTLGAAAMPGGGGGGGAGGGQFFTVAGVAGQSVYPVTLPAARLDASYEVLAIVNSPAANMLKLITIDPTTIANVGFTAELSAGAEAGDILVFFVHDV